MQIKRKTLRGDTLVEVMFAIGIFAMVAISVSTLMNSMLGKSQSAIEIVMARSEIDAQAEALRYIHSSRNNDTMKKVWEKIADNAQPPSKIEEFFLDEDYYSNHTTSCPGTSSSNAFPNYAFYIDSFKLNDPSQDNIYIPLKKNMSDPDHIISASTFPRVLHNSENDNIVKESFGENSGDSKAEGIWVVAVKDKDEDVDPEYYDFYIQTCWNSLGSSMPSTISTIVRLRNPTKVAVNPVAPSTPTPPTPAQDDGNGDAGEATPDTTTVIFRDYNGEEIRSVEGRPGDSVTNIPPTSRNGYTFLYWENGTAKEKTDIKFPERGATDTWTATYAKTTIYYSVSYNERQDGKMKDITQTGSLSIGNSFETNEIVCGSESVTFEWGDSSSSLTNKVVIANPGGCTGIWLFNAFSNPWKAKLTYSLSDGSVTGSSSD